MIDKNNDDNSTNSKEVLENIISSSVMFSEEVWDLLAKHIVIKSAAKSKYLLSHSNHEKYVRIIIEGIVRITYHDKESYVYDFRSTNNFLCDTVSLLEKKHSFFSFYTVTPCKWLEIDGDTFIELSHLDSKLKLSMTENINKYLKYSHTRMAFIRSHSAEERYRIFCEEYSDILKYAKLGDIASYLGITQQSLSRIRKSK